MRIAVFGLGCVGSTMAACLVGDGHDVLGIDVDRARAGLLAAGRSPVAEPELDGLLAAGLAAGRLRAGTGSGMAVEELDHAIVCVGTPGRADGELDLASLRGVIEDLAAAVRRRDATNPPLLIVVRSTVPPGTMEGLVLPLLESVAGEGPGSRYELAYNPEFLRAGTAVQDYRAPTRIVLGERFPGATRRLRGIYATVAAPLLEVPFAAAEAVKLVDNAWHALKVTFANEIGRLCVEHGIPPQTVADLFLADTRLNLSGTYLRPGPPYGGPCLAKDLAALQALASRTGLETPVLGAVAGSNRSHLAWLLRRVRQQLRPPGPILLLGLSFKARTDRLDGSPALELALGLMDKGYEILVHDPDLAGTGPLPFGPGVSSLQRARLAGAILPEIGAALARARLVLRLKPIEVAGVALSQDVPVLDLWRLELPRGGGAADTASREGA